MQPKHGYKSYSRNLSAVQPNSKSPSSPGGNNAANFQPFHANGGVYSNSPSRNREALNSDIGGIIEQYKRPKLDYTGASPAHSTMDAPAGSTPFKPFKASSRK